MTTGSKDAEGSQCTYKVEVKTGNVRGAGTDANVQVGCRGMWLPCPHTTAFSFTSSPTCLHQLEIGRQQPQLP